ncbi:hypothetical protein Tco_1433213, partial [Tanacetum coccineum]
MEEALATYEATRVANDLEAENQSQTGSDGDNGNGGNRNGRNGNGRNGNGGNGNPNENNRDARPVAREFKYAIWTLLNSELTRWNSHKRTIGAEDAFVMSWRELMKLMAELKGYAENKRRLEVNQRDNCGQQPPFKRPNVGGQNVARAYTTDNNKRKPYNGPLTLCSKCKLYHEGPCTMRYGKSNKAGHLTWD